MPMTITLARTPGWRSCYDGAALPARMRYLHPAALAALAPLAGRLVFSDVYRSPTSSIVALRGKTGVARPGFSAHNFGLAVDLDIGASCWARRGDKAGLDAAMLAAGWRCFRGDHRPKAEAWHYTFGAPQSGSPGVGQAIDHYYAPSTWSLPAPEIQSCLKKLGLYDGEIDGDLGRLSKAAIEVFKRGWMISEPGVGPTTLRTLAVVSAEIEISA